MSLDFANYVKDHLTEYLPSDYSDAIFKISKTRKSNGRNLTGLLIRNDLEKGTPTIYIDEFEERVNQGEALSKVMNEIASLVIESKNSPIPKVCDSVVGSVLDYEKMKPLLALRMCDRFDSADYLEDKPYTPFGNLAITYRIQMMNEGNFLGTAIIDNNLLKAWNISKTQLHRDALKAENERNGIKLYENSIISKSHYHLKNVYDSKRPIKKTQYILTNKQITNGACVIAQNGVLKHIGELLREDYFILPSSIHELIIIPRSLARSNLKRMDKILKSGNEMLSEDDKLSDHVLLYHRKTNTMIFCIKNTICRRSALTKSRST